ncbi:MAG: squalene synthase HpnC [Ignavibacterium sp.]
MPLPISDPPAPAFTGSADDAYRYCRQLAISHYENFPVASWLIPRDKRKHVAAIYAFARIADDYADEPGLEASDRLKRLYEWRGRLKDCFAGNATHPVFIALQETVRTFSIPLELLDRLLDAFISDVSVRRYETMADVLAYCSNSANPIGRIILLLFGYRIERLALLSDHICTALQLTNFWQDVSIDLQKDRVYIPMEDLRRFGVTVGDLHEKEPSDSFRALMKAQVDRTTELFEQGRPLLCEVGSDLRIQLRATWWGGMTILNKIKELDYDTLHRRPTLTLFDKLRVLLHVLPGLHHQKP